MILIIYDLLLEASNDSSARFCRSCGVAFAAREFHSLHVTYGALDLLQKSIANAGAVGNGPRWLGERTIFFCIPSLLVFFLGEANPVSDLCDSRSQ